jgi:hypothetical protein
MDVKKAEMDEVLVAEATISPPQIELWGHLCWIAKKITDRTRTEVNSIYKTIYGGISQPKNMTEKDVENEDSKLWNNTH